jgi:hypothetical protein
VRRVVALALAVVGQSLLAAFDPSLALVPAFATFAAAAALVVADSAPAAARAGST